MPADEDKGGAEEDEKPEEENANLQPDEEMEEDPKEEQAEDRQQPEMPNYDDANPNQDNVAPSDVRNGGQDQDANQTEDQDTAQESSAQRESGEMGESAAEQDASTGDKGNISKSQEQPAQSDLDNAQESTVDQPFKALGDALEKWHRQQRDIKEAQSGEPEETAAKDEQDMASKEFQHLQNDDMAADTQAIGTTTEEESRPFDDEMAIDDEEQAPDSRIMPEDEEPAGAEDAADKMDMSEPTKTAEKPEQQQKDEGQPGVSTRKGAYDREITPPTQGVERQEQDEEDIDETSVQLSETYISEPAVELRDFDEAMQQWGGFQAKTNPLSLALTSQLRLILTPSQSTKLSGSYRTGKRLNIKRIIPYIASSYKRDKIWMRRAIPTKRSYQILLCVDDSKSMGESASGALALESLVMVSRALTLLEVGQIGVLGFGQHTFMAHDFAEPFASHDAGARVLQRFRFQQDHTDVKALVRDTIARFRAARLQNPGRGGEDLWQLALILSDGLTPSQDHDEIRRLLREAMEERIMIVFIIMDEASSSGGGKTSSVLNLRTAKFVTDAMGEMKVKTETYLDTFPFQYYLIVHDLQDLPAALAGLLRSWFAEVNA